MNNTDIVARWLSINGYQDIESTSNGYFIKANGRNSRILVVVKDDGITVDNDILMIFGYKNRRRIWIANVIDKETINWEIL